MKVIKNENEKVEKQELGMSQIMQNWDKPPKLEVVDLQPAEVSQVEKDIESGVNLADMIQISEPKEAKKKGKKIIEPAEPIADKLDDFEEKDKSGFQSTYSNPK